MYYFFLFLRQNICCGYSKEPSQIYISFEDPNYEFKQMDKTILTILLLIYLLTCSPVSSCPLETFSLSEPLFSTINVPI